MRFHPFSPDVFSAKNKSPYGGEVSPQVSPAHRINPAVRSPSLALSFFFLGAKKTLKAILCRRYPWLLQCETHSNPSSPHPSAQKKKTHVSFVSARWFPQGLVPVRYPGPTHLVEPRWCFWAQMRSNSQGMAPSLSWFLETVSEFVHFLHMSCTPASARPQWGPGASSLRGSLPSPSPGGTGPRNDH